MMNIMSIMMQYEYDNAVRVFHVTVMKYLNAIIVTVLLYDYDYG